MTFLIFGADGQVGSALKAKIPAESVGVDVADCDICDASAVSSLVTRVKPAAIINCAAYTAVDKAETDATTAFAVNGTGPENLARAAAISAIPLLHISTDYVYAGTGSEPHDETAPIAPGNVYGASKAVGDTAVAHVTPQHVILRVSWVFSPIGNNFVKTMLRLGRERPELGIVDDQIGGPTEAADISTALLTIARRCLEPGFDDWGLYHFASAPAVSWYEFARAIFERSHGPKPVLKPIATSAYPLPARRPLNSRLDCTKIARVFGLAQPDWRRALDRVVPLLEGHR